MQFLFILASILIMACTGNTQLPTENKNINEAKKSYWYNGEAEITSFDLKQARYGEMREGKAVLVYVTEAFSKNKFVKADNPTKEDIPVLKLNATKNFNTGIYPYSMMNSSFFPFENGIHSLKITSSSQEWCGHNFMELKNKKDFEINVNSYFENESSNIKLDKNILEDDIWTMIRLSPNDLPIGNVSMIPSFFFLRLKHVECKAYSAEISKSTSEKTASYSILYPELERSLIINFEKDFPYRILSWEESYSEGFGSSRKKMTTSASRIKTIKSAYWSKNKNQDAYLREELGL